MALILPADSRRTGAAVNRALWVTQLLLAAAFASTGTAKLVRSKEQIAEVMGWVEDYQQRSIRAIGALEVLGAVGLVLPAATGVAEVLTPMAAVGLALLMVGAAVTHLRRGEPRYVVLNALLFAGAVFVAWGRISGG
jgi:uncharacterized membrane protein